MNKDEILNILNKSLKSAMTSRQNAMTSPSLLLAKKRLKEFQLSRLRQTHQDLLNDYTTAKAAQFFLNEVYGSHDLNQRDKDLERFVPMITTIFPLNTIETIAKAAQLDALTEKLDTALALALSPNFSEQEYKEKYLIASSRQERLLQLDLVQELGVSLASLVHIPFLASTLKVMRLPAKMANMSALHEFLETGFNTFKSLPDPEGFIRSITSKERAILENLHTNRDDPLTLHSSSSSTATHAPSSIIITDIKNDPRAAQLENNRNNTSDTHNTPHTIRENDEVNATLADKITSISRAIK